MPKNPAVSIVLPTHNRARELRLSIQSVISQTFTDFELLIVDDASSENIADVVHTFNDNRIRLIRTETNVGGGEARNIGIREARASLIAFQDSDDEWRCHKLEQCMSVLQQDTSLDGVFSAYWQIDQNRSRYLPTVTPPLCADSMYETLLSCNFVDTPTVVIRTELLGSVGGFDPEMPRYQDWDLFLRLSKVGRFRFIPEALILSHVTQGSISMDLFANRDAAIRIYEKNRTAIDGNKPLKALWLSRIGDAKLLTGNIAGGRRDLVAAMKLQPLSLRFAGKAILAILGSVHLYVYVRNRFPKRL